MHMIKAWWSDFYDHNTSQKLEAESAKTTTLYVFILVCTMLLETTHRKKTANLLTMIYLLIYGIFQVRICPENNFVIMSRLP